MANVVLDIKENSDNNTIFISGNVLDPGLYNEMIVIAANPIDRMMNYTGSGLPFPSPEIAFEGTPNMYVIGSDGVINVTFTRPNSYYAIGAERIEPSVFVKLNTNKESDPVTVQFKLTDLYPLKSVYYRKEREDLGPLFYEKKADIIGVRSQYEIIKMLEDIKKRGFA
jgi:hypothetical protein